jgi:SAM-dependent methyltransferase
MSQLWASRSYSTLAPLHAGPPGRFLDIACGLGQTVKCFEDNGWAASGIDVDANTKPFHEQLGIDTRVGRIEDIGIDGQFDIIHIAHAIYFVADPMGFLRQVRAHLTHGGIFAVLISDFLASTDPAYPAYFHTFYPTGSSMRYALALAGFDSSPAQTRKGSIFIAARPGRGVLPVVRPRLTRLAYATKTLRYQLFGRIDLAARRIAKKIIGPN